MMRSSISCVLLETARSCASDTALVCDGDSRTFTQLQEMAARIPLNSIKKAGKKGLVGIYGRNDFLSYSALFFCLTREVPFCFIDASLPAIMKKNIIRKTGITFFVTSPVFGVDLASVLDERIHDEIYRDSDVVCQGLYLPAVDNIVCDELQGPDLAADVAYVKFTSGSSGSPKVVPVTRRNLKCFLIRSQRLFHVRQHDVISQTFPFSFDLSLFGPLLAWSTGASVCQFEANKSYDIESWIYDNKISIWFSVPTLAKRIGCMSNQLPLRNRRYYLRLILFCGEPLSWAIVQKWKTIFPAIKVNNLYGPTETTLACSFFDIDKRVVSTQPRSTWVPIGTLFSGHTYILIDNRNRPVEQGLVGELCVSGPQVFPGYLRADLSVERKESFLMWQKKLYYKTGDLVKESPDKVLLFIGRKDRQMKLMGVRVAPTTIEEVLLEIPGVVNAFVTVVTFVNRGPICVALVEGNASKDKIRSVCKRHLPATCVPRKVIFIESIPRTLSGKTDLSEAMACVLKSCEKAAR